MDKIFNYVEKYYHKITGLLLGFPLIFFVLFLPINRLLREEEILKFSQRFLYIYCGLCIICVIVWIIIHSHFPSNLNNKIGIIICVDAESEKQKIRLKKDFVNNLKTLLKTNGLFDLFHTVVLKDYQAERAIKIIDEYNNKKSEIIRKNQINISNIKKPPKEIRKWKKFDKKVRGHFYIWGNIKERYDIDKKYFIETNALVKHVPISFSKSDEIRDSLNNIYGRLIVFDERVEFAGFHLTADIVYLSARYIIGIASLYSYDPFTALTLHKGLDKEIENRFKPLPQNLLKVLEHLKVLLSKEYYLIAFIKYKIYKDIRGAKEFIEQSLSVNPKNYDALIFKSLLAFVVDRNPTETLKMLLKAKKYSNNDYTWLYNKAFLYMYVGKFEKGFNDYKKLNTISFQNEDKIVQECIDFNKQLIEQEPNKKQALFILGFLYYKKLGNYPLALEYFERFERETKGNEKYKYLLKRSTTYIGELKKAMEIRD